jgi:catechol 2,3-dioxygenase-like lactoylglutathione lyase family enzyme
MSDAILRRTTFIVPDAEAAAQFYVEVFGWARWYDNTLAVDGRFPPAAAHGAKARLILLQVQDPKIGMLGLMQYLEPPFDTGVKTQRTKVSMGEAILVVTATDLDAIHGRARRAGANVLSPPADWEVPSHDGKDVIKLRTMTMFDPNGIYIEVNAYR